VVLFLQQGEVCSLSPVLCKLVGGLASTVGSVEPVLAGKESLVMGLSAMKLNCNGTAWDGVSCDSTMAFDNDVTGCDTGGTTCSVPIGSLPFHTL